MRRRKKWTWSTERDAALLLYRQAGHTWLETLGFLNEMAGRRIISTEAARIRHSRLNRMLPVAGGKPDLQVPSAPASAAPAAAVPGTATGILDVSSLNLPLAENQPGVFSGGSAKLTVPYPVARKWACVNGLCNKYSGLNLKVVNSVRLRAGLQPFVLEGAL